MHTQNNSYGNMNGFIEAGTSGAKGHVIININYRVMEEIT